jgi:hypothetical protein
LEISLSPDDVADIEWGLKEINQTLTKIKIFLLMNISLF